MRAASRGHAQRGLSLVELMVGVAIALLIAAAGTLLLAGHLQENRRLLVEARLMQDLRTAADVVTRDLRRAGYWGDAAAGAWMPGTTSVVANPYAAYAPDSATSDTASFRYSRDATENNSVDSNEQFGFRLRNGAIELQLGAGNWQALTDTGTLTVTSFTLTPQWQDTSLACSKPCPSGSTTCPPRQRVRSLAVAIGGRAATDASVVRGVHGSVRLRNDMLIGNCPA
jgi:type IV pilus assembly protein PilW